MPQSASRKKRLGQDEKRRGRNRSLKREIKTRTKTLEEAVEENEKDKVVKLLRLVISRIDKAKKRHVLHRNKAARLQSRLTRLVNTITS